MAMDLTGGPIPNFAALDSVDTTVTEIRLRPWSRVMVFATDAIYLCNGVADGGTVAAAALRLGLTQTQAAQGILLPVGGPVAGQTYATLCVASQSGTITVTAVGLPAEQAAR